MPEHATLIDLRGFQRIREDKLLAWLLAGAIFLASVLVRVELDARNPAVALVTCMPAISLIALAAGWRIAAIITALSAISFWWPPFLRGAMPPSWPWDLLEFLVFAVSGVVIVLVVEGLAHLAWPDATIRALNGVAMSTGVSDSAARAPVDTYLGIIDAILRAPGDGVEDRQDGDAVAAARARMRMLRIVADRMHDGGNGGEWARILRRICHDIVRAHGTPDVRIQIETADGGMTSARLAILSTIVAELLTRTLQAAAPAQKPRRFEVVLRDIGERHRGLEIRATNGWVGEGDAVHGANAGILEALAGLLDATLTFAGDPDIVVGLVFAR